MKVKDEDGYNDKNMSKKKIPPGELYYSFHMAWCAKIFYFFC